MIAIVAMLDILVNLVGSLCPYSGDTMYIGIRDSYGDSKAADPVSVNFQTNLHALHLEAIQVLAEKDEARSLKRLSLQKHELLLLHQVCFRFCHIGD